MIKLVATDLDGTVVPEGTADIHPDFYNLIRKLKAKGITFVAASGREFDTMKTVMGPVQEDIYFITNNGARIIEHGERELLRLSIDWKDTCDIIKYVRGLDNIFYAVNTPEGTLVDRRDEEILDLLKNGYKLRYHMVDDILESPIDNLKVSLYVRSDAAKAAEPIKELFGERVNVTAAGAHWVDFIHKDADKGRTLEILMDRLGIKKEECWSFGDNYNDISLIKAAGTGFSAPGAREGVCEAADVCLEGDLKSAVYDRLCTLL